MNKFQPGDLIYGTGHSEIDEKYGLGLILGTENNKYWLIWLNNSVRTNLNDLEVDHYIVSSIFRDSFSEEK